MASRPLAGLAAEAAPPLQPGAEALSDEPLEPLDAPVELSSLPTELLELVCLQLVGSSAEGLAHLAALRGASSRTRALISPPLLRRLAAWLGLAAPRADGGGGGGGSGQPAVSCEAGRGGGGDSMQDGGGGGGGAGREPPCADPADLEDLAIRAGVRSLLAPSPGSTLSSLGNVVGFECDLTHSLPPLPAPSLPSPLPPSPPRSLPARLPPTISSRPAPPSLAAAHPLQRDCSPTLTLAPRPFRFAGVDLDDEAGSESGICGGRATLRRWARFASRHERLRLRVDAHVGPTAQLHPRPCHPLPPTHPHPHPHPHPFLPATRS